MATTRAPLHAVTTKGIGKRIGIVAAVWHGEIVDAMLQAAVETLDASGVKQRDIEVVRVPGTFELPLTAAALAHTHRFDAIIALGVVIRGETAHFEYVAGPVAYALQNLAVETGLPIVFGVLTTETEEQARARAGGPLGNKGSESAYVALEMTAILHEIQTGKLHT